MLNTIKIFIWLGLSGCLLAILAVITTFFLLKPSLPEISLVDESQLQMPLKIYTEDAVLIGEFGEIKRRPLKFNEIPIDIKNAFLAAEDDAFFNHQGISYTGLLRSIIRCIGPDGCFGGGGTISMQVVRGYLLTRDQTILRKAKEIFLALELESNLTKEEIFELYVNRNFFGNRSYGIEAASNTYFNKSVPDLTLAESAAIAAMAQSPSRINAIKAPLRTKQRRYWILSRMLKLRLINSKTYIEALDEPLRVANDIDLYETDGRYLAELARQEIIKRYGLKAYKNGWSVFTTINSKSQDSAQKHLNAGAKKVLISAPAQNPDKTIVYGVNHETLSHGDKIISNASCTTNCLAPLAKVINDNFVLKSGLINTVHASTNDQSLLDVAHSDLYRARAASASIIPSKTGAAKAIGLVIPELEGKLNGMATRVPVLNVSMLDMTFETAKKFSIQELIDSIVLAAGSSMNGVLSICDLPLVSADFNHNDSSSIFDLNHIYQIGNQTKILAWYDNEWGFSKRMLEMSLYIKNLSKVSLKESA